MSACGNVAYWNVPERPNIPFPPALLDPDAMQRIVRKVRATNLNKQKPVSNYLRSRNSKNMTSLGEGIGLATLGDTTTITLHLTFSKMPRP